MRLLSRYLAREIYMSTALVFAGLLMLFAFLDLVHELNLLGHGNYRLSYVMMFVLLTVPGHMYELFPVAVLVGTIVAVVQMAAHSELTIYRASGASVQQMVKMLFRAGLPFVVLTLLCGEFLAPASEHMAQELKLKALNAEVSVKEFRTGVWVKDEHSFVNIRNVLPDTSLLNLTIYEFDEEYRMRSIISAKRAVFQGGGRWLLEQVMQTGFDGAGAQAKALDHSDWYSAINPELLNVLMVVPEQMSAWNLYQYTEHLRENHQQVARYEIALWNKLVYPFAVLVMMLLALPFATHQRRSGGVGTKIFTGIVLGLSFHFMGRLFSNLGALNGWSPLLSATGMTLLFLSMAIGMLWWEERR